MKINETGDKVTLELNGKTIQGHITEEEDFYFNCKYLFETSPEDVLVEDIQSITAEEFCDDTVVVVSAKDVGDAYLSYVVIGKKRGVTYYRTVFFITSEKWDENANFNKFVKKLENFGFDEQYAVEIDYIDYTLTVGLEFSSSTSGSLTEQIEKSTAYFHQVKDQTISNIVNPDSFISQFNFPQEYRYVFTQYLTYFGKFLEDLGIAGEVSIEQKDGKTILKVTSDQKQENLDQINAALLSYISLPSADISTIVKPTPDLESQIRLQQLLSAVDHMKSQLHLSKAMISLKDREIELLHATNNQLRTSLIPHAELSSDLTDYWEPMEGVKIKAYKGEFFEIDIPLWVKKTQKWLQKK
jgi:hypothetical protein